ncbi:MAG TPA: hypothetical protein VM680_02195, partial [Verrucomicrobiae bacterium]|nr:hypothetical protein [Verrucomicrobiae bacterium]
QAFDGDLKPGESLRLGTVELQLERATVAEPARVPEPVPAGAGDRSETWTHDEKPRSLLGKLTQTMKIGFKR